MAIIPIPAKLSFSSIQSFMLERSTAVLRSRFTGARQVLLYPYAVWSLKAKLKDYAPEDAGVIKSFLAKLDGTANTFRLPVPGYTRPLNGYTGDAAVAVATAPIGATTMSINGLQIGPTVVVQEGDYFTIQDELKIVTLDLLKGGPTTTANITFEPPLRKAAPVGTPVIFQNPTCLMCAVDDDAASWSMKPPIVHGFDFEAIEALDLV